MDDADTVPPPSLAQPIISVEGTRFGFPPSEQFDGYSEEMQRSSTPPLTLEMATRDTNVTNLADLNEPQRVMESLGIALDEQGEATRGELQPPPPDPSDPPPSIDSNFRSFIDAIHLLPLHLPSILHHSSHLRSNFCGTFLAWLP